MDQREGSKGRARGEEEEWNESPAVMISALAAAAAADALAEMTFHEAAPAVVEGGDGPDGDAWKPPPGVFDFWWLKCRGGLGAPAPSAVVELREVFFRSLVDGHTAAIGVPGDRFIPPPSIGTLFEVLAEWLATAGEDEVDPLWRSVLEGGNPDA